MRARPITLSDVDQPKEDRDYFSRMFAALSLDSKIAVALLAVVLLLAFSSLQGQAPAENYVVKSSADGGYCSICTSIRESCAATVCAEVSQKCGACSTEECCRSELRNFGFEGA